MSVDDTSQQPVRMRVAGRTDRGQKRMDNQDSMLATDLSRSAADGGHVIDPAAVMPSGTAEFELGAGGAVMLVADGMGGAAAGARASRMAVDEVERELSAGWGTDGDRSATQLARRLRHALEVANTRIFEAAKQDSACAGMGTTATLAGVVGDTICFAQVGDSRAYVVRNGAAVQVTRDQSFVQELVDAGTLTEDEAERSVHANKILQALGAAPGVKVVLTSHQLRRNDVVLLCSDGLTRVVRKEEIGLAAASSADLASLCEALVALANERGGPDNVTVVAARFDGEGLAFALPHEAVERKPLELSASADDSTLEFPVQPVR